MLDGPPEPLPNGRVMAGALDDRVGIFAGLEILRRLAAARPAWDVALVVSGQEETGTHGGRPSRCGAARAGRRDHPRGHLRRRCAGECALGSRRAPRRRPDRVPGPGRQPCRRGRPPRRRCRAGSRSRSRAVRPPFGRRRRLHDRCRRRLRHRLYPAPLHAFGRRDRPALGRGRCLSARRGVHPIAHRGDLVPALSTCVGAPSPGGTLER